MINIIIKQHRTSEKYDESVPSIIVIIVEKNLGNLKAHFQSVHEGVQYGLSTEA